MSFCTAFSVLLLSPLFFRSLSYAQFWHIEKKTVETVPNTIRVLFGKCSNCDGHIFILSTSGNICLIHYNKENKNNGLVLHIYHHIQNTRFYESNQSTRLLPFIHNFICINNYVPVISKLPFDLHLVTHKISSSRQSYLYRYSRFFLVHIKVFMFQNKYFNLIMLRPLYPKSS